MEQKLSKCRDRLSFHFAQSEDQAMSPQAIYLDNLSAEHCWEGWGGANPVPVSPCQEAASLRSIGLLTSSEATHRED